MFLCTGPRLVSKFQNYKNRDRQWQHQQHQLRHRIQHCSRAVRTTFLLIFFYGCVAIYAARQEVAVAAIVSATATAIATDASTATAVATATVSATAYAAFTAANTAAAVAKLI